MEFFVLENRTYRRESKSFILLMKLSNVISLSAIDCPYSLFSHSVEEVVCGEWALTEEDVYYHYPETVLAATVILHSKYFKLNFCR